MITRGNVRDVIRLLSEKDKKRVLNSDKEYTVLYLHTFSDGSHAAVRLTNDYNRYKNVSNYGHALLYTAHIQILIKGQE